MKLHQFFDHKRRKISSRPVSQYDSNIHGNRLAPSSDQYPLPLESVDDISIIETLWYQLLLCLNVNGSAPDNAI